MPGMNEMTSDESEERTRPLDFRVVSRDGANVLQQWRLRSDGSATRWEWVDVWAEPRGARADAHGRS